MKPKWRPEKEWRNPFNAKDSLTARTCYTIYEEGADAMLEAIKGRGFISGESLRNVKGAIGWACISPDSKWYPIPDEEIKK